MRLRARVPIIIPIFVSCLCLAVLRFPRMVKLRKVLLPRDEMITRFRALLAACGSPLSGDMDRQRCGSRYEKSV